MPVSSLQSFFLKFYILKWPKCKYLTIKKQIGEIFESNYSSATPAVVLGYRVESKFLLHNQERSHANLCSKRRHFVREMDQSFPKHFQGFGSGLILTAQGKPDPDLWFFLDRIQEKIGYRPGSRIQAILSWSIFNNRFSVIIFYFFPWYIFNFWRTFCTLFCLWSWFCNRIRIQRILKIGSWQKHRIRRIPDPKRCLTLP